MTGGITIPFLFLVAAAAALAAASLPDRGASPRLAASVRTYLKTMHSDWTIGTLVFIGILTTVATVVVIGATTENWPLGVVLGAGLGPLAVWQFLQWNLRRYRAGFRRQFLPALDIIVRGLRSGMPLIPALQVVHKEVAGPVRAEFRRLLDDLALGLPLTQAVERMADRIPTTEVQFFAAVIGFQARTGGRLSEALENLGGTLRARDQLDLRIRTVSQEVRTSATIIAVLPAFVMLGLFVLNHDYVSLLFRHPLGQAVLIGAVLWMAFGAWIMKRMTVIDV